MAEGCGMVHKSQLPDPFLYELWDLLRDSGIEKATFRDGYVVNHHSFRDMVRGEGTHFWALFMDGIPAGFVWINAMQGRSAHIHFAGFRHARGGMNIRLGRFALSNILRFRDAQGRYLLDVLIGVTPKCFGLAVKLARQCGGALVGEMPRGAWFAEGDHSEDAIVTSFTRDSTEEAWMLS